MNKEQILERLRECVEQQITNEGFTQKLMLDKVAELVIELANQPANTTDSDSVFIGPEAGLDTGFIVPEPPKSAGVKTATEYLMKAHGQPIAALTTQAWDHEIELEEFAQYCSEQELCSGDAGIVWLSMNAKDRIREFRNQKPRV